MVRIGKEVAACKRWSTRQHLSALKRIIPRKQVKAALRQTRLRGNPCSRVGDDFMVWFVIAIGLFCRDCYRQIHRWLVPWKRNGVPGRSTLCMAGSRIRSPSPQGKERAGHFLSTGWGGSYGL